VQKSYAPIVQVKLHIVKHALERLDHLIAIEINPQKNNNLNIIHSHIENWSLTAKSEIENIARYLLRRSVKLKKEKEIELLVQQYQGNIILFLDKVFIYKSSNTSPLYLQLFESILQQLDELLTHIEQRYTRYFNQEEKVPDCYLNLIQQDISRELNRVNKFILKSMDPQLAEVILKPIKSFIRTKNGNISYKQVIYMKTLIKEIAQLPLLESITEEAITQSLIYMNFNSTSFINFVIDRKVIEINKATPSEKLELLTIQLKKINLMGLKPGAALYHNKPSAKERLKDWLTEEINFMEVQQSLFIRPSPSQLSEPEEHRVHTSLSVQQLALWIRTAKDVGIITNKNQSILLKTIAKMFRTPHSESISSESLHSKFYAPETSAKKAVKDLMLEMFNQVQKYALYPVLIQTIFYTLL
jgi:hypothetical protein